jgi:hypothetical protein
MTNECSDERLGSIGSKRLIAQGRDPLVTSMLRQLRGPLPF